MSKYYKAEDIIRKRAEDLADTSYWEYGNPKNVDEWLEVAEMEFKDLPTIEVSDKADRPFEYFEGYEDGRKSIEVSEDCISREQVRAKLDYISYAEKDPISIAKRIVDNAPSVVPKTQIKAQNSNENSNGISVSDGVSEMIRCAMCNNPNQSYKGCDGACSYDEKLYKRIMDAINASSVVPKRSCYRCGLREDCEDSTERKPKEGEWADIFDIMCVNERIEE